MEIFNTLTEWLSSPSGQVAIVIATFALTIVAFIADKVRSDIVALCSLALLLVTNVLTPAEALAGFSNSAVVMMIGLFVVGGAVFQTGLARIISGRLLKLAGTSEVKLFFSRHDCHQRGGRLCEQYGYGSLVVADYSGYVEVGRHESCQTYDAIGLCQFDGWHIDTHRYTAQPHR